METERGHFGLSHNVHTLFDEGLNARGCLGLEGRHRIALCMSAQRRLDAVEMNVVLDDDAIPSDGTAESIPGSGARLNGKAGDPELGCCTPKWFEGRMVSRHHRSRAGTGIIVHNLPHRECAMVGAAWHDDNRSRTAMFVIVDGRQWNPKGVFHEPVCKNISGWHAVLGRNKNGVEKGGREDVVGFPVLDQLVHEPKRGYFEILVGRRFDDGAKGE